MKLTQIFSGIGIVFCLLFCASAGHAQTLYGRTEVQYNESTRFMTATSSTEVDFAAMEFYQGYVNIKLTDGAGNNMAVQTLADTDRDGFVEYSNTFAAGPDYSEYMLTGTHRARMDIQDPALNYRYVDNYYFGYNADMGSEGRTAWRWVMFFGPGPRKNWTTPWLTIAGTIDANIALNMPQGVSGLTSVGWKDLNDEEKKFVIDHPTLAASFLIERNDAIEDTQANFSSQDMKDGRRGNAFQHAMWSALMTQVGGENYAAEFGNAHEKYPGWDQSSEAPFRNMDLYNNNIGRQIATCNFTATRAEMVNLIIQALNSGQLQVVCPPTCKEP